MSCINITWMPRPIPPPCTASSHTYTYFFCYDPTSERQLLAGVITIRPRRLALWYGNEATPPPNTLLLSDNLPNMNFKQPPQHLTRGAWDVPVTHNAPGRGGRHRREARVGRMTFAEHVQMTGLQRLDWTGRGVEKDVTYVEGPPPPLRYLWVNCTSLSRNCVTSW